MLKEDIIKQIPKVLESIGVLGSETIVEETDLNEWIVDSVMFISFIVELENTFGVQIPDSLLQHETISSISGLADIIIGLQNEENSDRFYEERKDLENEIVRVREYIDELNARLKEESSQECKEEILTEIVDQKTIIRDIECMIADLE